MYRIILLFLLLSLTNYSVRSQDSSGIRISLLTCTPGDDLYAIFGHSAFRVIDSNSVSNHDLVFNYGTFNFDDEGFYIKFARGKLLYYISIERFEDFTFYYKAMGREMREQVLDLSGAEKTALKNALLENLKEENKYYKYDFFFDNCTTRLRDLVLKYKKPQPHLPAVMPAKTRFREAIHAYLEIGHQYWSELGIDILLGAPTDRIMTAEEQQFLPDNLMKAIDSSKPVIVSSAANLYELPEKKDQLSWFTPKFFFWALFTLIVMLSVLKNQFVQTMLQRLDGFLFFMTGLLGIILILMWIATDHSMTKNNYNLLWAWPTHLVAAFFINSKKEIIRKYFLLNAILLTVLLFAWYFLPQQMNNALIPFVLLLIYRSMMKYNRRNDQ